MSEATEDLPQALHRTATKILRHARRTDGTAGVGPAQMDALAVLSDAGPLSIRDLARCQGVAHGTMSRIVISLSEAGLIETAPSEEDRRSKLVTATAAGRALHQAARARRLQIVGAFIAMIGEPAARQVVAALETIAAQIREP
jgi:DNA-binding MarR family transcriptional regulator